MTFNTEKNKIFKIWNDSIENQFQITTLADNDKIILSKVNNLNRVSTVYKNMINLSSDWITPDSQINEETIYSLFKEFTIEINGINENIIPFIESKISYRLGDSSPSMPIPDALYYPKGTAFDDIAIPEINSITEIKPSIEENPNDLLKNIIYITSFYLYEWDGLPAELQIKFYINIVNPIYYQST